ncbi:hypothetical protein [Sinosporangium siamense]|uniref:Uncharacterized protein n=1 Tax=Sinosporangium siamense TaxID=1367973 RepID=A0A919RD43_9ACTN|nr:hypothetical protein [Sinosporangium siamense]GII90254.1 hypothetical protein Ssi02_04850 [Sinosporangium siamense]
MSYFEGRVGEALYGTPARPSRWHKTVEEDLSGSVLRALELVRDPLDGDRGLAVYHVELGGDPLAEVSRLAALPLTDAGALGARLPAGTAQAGPARRAQTVSFVSFTGFPVPVMPEEYAEWDAVDQWLWLLASATPVERFPPDPKDESLFSGRVRLSASWRALVLRDGVAFVGTTPDPGAEAHFLAAAQVYAHSLYLDTVLLGAMQVTTYNRLANQLAGTQTLRLRRGTLAEWEGRLITARNTVGMDTITTRGKGNELLERYREQHRVPQLIAHLTEGLTSSARYIEAAASHGVVAALGLFTSLGLPFGLAYAAGALWGDGGLGLFLWCTAAAAATAVLLTALLPQVRSLVTDLLNDRSR